MEKRFYPLILLSLIAVTLLFVLFLAGGCGLTSPTGTSTPISGEDLTATVLCIAATDKAASNVFIWKVNGTPTLAPGVTPSPTPRLLASTVPGDAEKGKLVFNGKGKCSGCHNVNDDEMFVGPSLRTIANQAGFRRPNMNAEDYLAGVIASPDLYVVPLNKPGIMPRTYRLSLTRQEIRDVIAYLMTLTG